MLFSETLKFSCDICVHGDRARDCLHFDRIQDGVVFVVKDRGRPTKERKDIESKERLRLDSAELDPFRNPKCVKTGKFKFQCNSRCCPKRKLKAIYIIEKSIKMTVIIEEKKELEGKKVVEDQIVIEGEIDKKSLPKSAVGNKVNYHRDGPYRSAPYNYKKKSNSDSTSSSNGKVSKPKRELPARSTRTKRIPDLEESDEEPYSEDDVSEYRDEAEDNNDDDEQTVISDADDDSQQQQPTIPQGLSTEIPNLKQEVSDVDEDDNDNEEVEFPTTDTPQFTQFPQQNIPLQPTGSFIGSFDHQDFDQSFDESTLSYNTSDNYTIGPLFQTNIPVESLETDGFGNLLNSRQPDDGLLLNTVSPQQLTKVEHNESNNNYLEGFTADEDDELGVSDKVNQVYDFADIILERLNEI